MRLKPLFATVVLTALALGTANARTFTLHDKGRAQTISVTPVTDDIVRVTIAPDGAKTASLPSLVTDEYRTREDASLSVKRGDGNTQVVVTDGGMLILLDEDNNRISFSYEGETMVTDLGYRDGASLRLSHNGEQSFYGAGERGFSFNLLGDTLVNYNKQNYGYVAGEPRIKQMGITMPMLISSKGYGIFIDDFCKSTMIVGKNAIEYTSTSPEPLTYYIISGKGRVENVVKNFTALVGRQDLPPLWTLGYITSRYGYRDQAESEGTVDTLKTRGYPLDGIVFDLYWYGKEEDMGRLEWDKTQWPDHRGMLNRFKEQGVHAVTISQPYVLTNGRAIDNYRLLDGKNMLCKTDGTNASQEVTIWVGQGGMFDVSNPDTRLWLRNRYKQLTDEGVTGWWGDLGEPEVHPLTIRHHNGLTAEQYHNLYGNDWSRIIYDLFKDEYPDRRLMTMMRAGTAGLQRYSVFPWSTDVSRSWGGFQPQVTIMLNSGLSGLGYMSHDVGGFAIDPENKRDGELYIRWLQLGLFSPVLRTHSQYLAEPYNYTEYGDLTLRIIKERYNWLPYNYNLAYENAAYGLPLVRPLGFYDSDNYFSRYDNIDDEFLWGHDILVAPVMKQGLTSRQVRFPEGEWIEWNNPVRRHKGYFTEEVDAPIDVIPVFVRAGAFIPMAGYEMQNVGDYNPDRLDIYYFPAKESSQYALFDDDLKSNGTLADGRHRLIDFSADVEENGVTFCIQARGTFDGASQRKEYNLVLPGFQISPAQTKITVNGNIVMPRYDNDKHTMTIPLTIDNINEPTEVRLSVFK